MKNSEWFWLSVCVTVFLGGVFLWGCAFFLELGNGQQLVCVMLGIALIATSLINFFGTDLNKAFDNWLDGLETQDNE